MLLILSLSVSLLFPVLVNAELIDNADGTVTDNVSGLTWLKESLPAPGEDGKTWTEAMLWANALVFAGHDDWRLPSALEFGVGTPDLLWNSTNNEFGNLYGNVWGNPAYASDIAPMQYYPCCYYWTSTEHPASVTEAVSFFVSYDGLWLNQFMAKTTQARYTAVRGVAKQTIAPQCNDGYDNDNNGLIDYPDDEGCSSLEDNTEFTCTGILAILKCRPFLPYKYRFGWLCFHIDDSTICLRWLVTVIVIGVIVAGGFWFFKRKKD